MWWSKSSPAPSANPKPVADATTLSSSNHPYEQTSSSSAETPWRWPDPPPDANGQSTAFAPQDDEENGSYNLSNTNKTERTKRETICGIRRKVFFLIIIGGALVAIAAVAIGIGAGIAFSKKRKPNSTPILSTSTSDITCPDSNNSTFQSPTNSEIYFRLSCGLDHPTSLGSTDLSSSSTSSMGACIDLCAEKDECLGASWEKPGDSDADGDEGGKCILKGHIGESESDGDGIFALRIDNPNKI